MDNSEYVNHYSNGRFSYVGTGEKKNGKDYFIIKCANCGEIFSRDKPAIRDRETRCPNCYRPKCKSYLRKLARDGKREEELGKTKTCVICGSEFHNSDERRKTCSSECARILKESNHGLKRLRHKGGNIIDYGITLKRVYERDNGKCWICGRQTDFDDVKYTSSGTKYCGDLHPVKDHIIPLAYGGDESWENIRLACWRCNREKSDAIVDANETERGRKIVVSERCGRKDGSIPVAQYSSNGDLIAVYDSAMQAERVTGITHSQISAARTGRIKTAHGYVWKNYKAIIKRENGDRGGVESA